MKKRNNNFHLRVTLDLTHDAWKGQMAQKIRLSIFKA